MTTKEIRKIITGLEHIVDSQDIALPVILDALIGVCFNEKEAGEIENYWLELEKLRIAGLIKLCR